MSPEKKEAKKLSDLLYRKKNAERIKIRRAEAYQANKEIITARNATWRAANMDKVRAIQKDYRDREDVKAKAKAYLADYYMENKERIARNHAEYNKKNAEKIKALAIRWRLANSEKLKLWFKNRYRRDRDKLLAQRKESYEKSKSYYKEYHADYTRNNPDKTAAWSAARRARKKGATPCWLTDEQLQRMAVMYSASQALNERGGEQYAVDHIVPLRGVRVSGLHVPWNLQILTREENSEKRNKLPPADQLVDYSAPGYAGVRAKLKGRAQ